MCILKKCSVVLADAEASLHTFDFQWAGLYSLIYILDEARTTFTYLVTIQFLLLYDLHIVPISVYVVGTINQVEYTKWSIKTNLASVGKNDRCFPHSQLQ